MVAPCTILVIDDDLDLRVSLAAVLEESGYRVEHAPSGARAMDSITLAPPDLILLDLMMPDGNGWDVLDMLRKTASASHVPVIVISAYASSIPTGARSLLKKPIGRDELLAAVSVELPATPS
jgi:CheY-like chemotaxis protein